MSQAQKRPPLRLRRSLLFMPGDDAHKIAKATTLSADAVIADLEDGVALNRKETARTTIVEAFRQLDFGSRERLVRLNPAGTPFHDEDLRATLPARPDGYVLPKVEDAQQIRSICRILEAAEIEEGWAPGSIRLLAIIESARGVMNLHKIARADRRLDALMFGAEDLASDLGAQRTKEGWEVFYARSGVVTAAAAYRLQAIDTVFVDLKDEEGLAAECRFARQMGFAGKMAIHPRQVPVINRSFSPAPTEVAAAQRLLDAFQKHQAEGTGVFVYEGKMVDMPMVRAAEKIIALAQAMRGNE